MSFLIRRVKGNSMSPSLYDGDIVVARSRTAYLRGDVVIFKLNGHEHVKRIGLIQKDMFYMLGDNDHDSHDSRQYGAIHKSAILGVVMKRLHLGKATAAPALRLPRWWFVPLALGGLNAAMALGQMASFEEFQVIIENYRLVEGQAATVLALGIIAFEILSLPVLFRLALSPAMRFLSTVSILIVPVLWTILVILGLAGGASLDNSGFFGKYLVQPLNWWVAAEGVLFIVWSLSSLHVAGYKTLFDGRK